jgi:hypothetical protein
MQVNFNTTRDDRGLVFEAIIHIENTLLSDSDFAEFRRLFSEVCLPGAGDFSINSDGVDHTIFAEFRNDVSLYDIEEAITLLDEYLTEVA